MNALESKPRLEIGPNGDKGLSVYLHWPDGRLDRLEVTKNGEVELCRFNRDNKVDYIICHQGGMSLKDMLLETAD